MGLPCRAFFLEMGTAVRSIPSSLVDAMREIATDVRQLCGRPRDLINTYLIGDVLIDAGTRWAKGRLVRELRGRPPRLLALTHCHPDHQGSAAAICREFG